MNLEDDNKLIEFARAFYAALVAGTENVSAIQMEKTGKAIFAKTPWSQLDAPSRLIMVRTMIMFRSPEQQIAIETKTDESDSPSE